MNYSLAYKRTHTPIRALNQSINQRPHCSKIRSLLDIKIYFCCVPTSSDTVFGSQVRGKEFLELQV